MIYLLYGKENILINEYINKLKEENKINNYDIEEYDLDVDSLKRIILSANTFSLFSSKKMIIIDNSFVFTGSNKKIEENEIEELNNYFDNINSNSIIIFKTNNETIDSRKKIVNKIKKIGTVVEFNKALNLSTKVKELFTPYKIDTSTINYLINRVGENIDILYKEIEKIKIYKDSNQNITINDIENLTNKNINTDIFNLLDNILNNNKEDALECLNEMIKFGEEPIKIIVMLSNQFRLIYQVKELYKKGYREYDIADILDQKPYTIKKACERINKYESSELLKYITDLSELDISIKSGNIDKNIGLELFIMNIKKEH